MEKSPTAFRTISEVSDTLEVPAHVLRFWEQKFPQIRPVKRGGGRRYYRPEDVALLMGIRELLYDDGLTIKGVQKVLRERGPRHVVARGAGAGVDSAGFDFGGDGGEVEVEHDEDSLDPDDDLHARAPQTDLIALATEPRDGPDAPDPAGPAEAEPEAARDAEVEAAREAEAEAARDAEVEAAREADRARIRSAIGRLEALRDRLRADPVAKH